MDAPFLPFDPEGDDRQSDVRQPRLRDISLRKIFPSLLTLLAICSGLTSIRFAVEGRLELAVAAIILAAILDGIDGRVARFLKSTSRFGAQMDSLADFVNFGVAPAMLLYFSLLAEVRSFGWIAVLFFAVCACLRLARFNVMIDMPKGPRWQNNYFVGVPAPAGALTVMAPVYILLLGAEKSDGFGIASALYAVIIGLLMISSLPSFSGKDMGSRVRREYVLPVLLFAVIFVASLLSWPWETLLAATVLYLASLPVSRHYWHVHAGLDEHQAEAAPKAEKKPRRKS